MTLNVADVVVGVGARRPAGRMVSQTAADPKMSQEEKTSWTCPCQGSEVRIWRLVGHHGKATGARQYRKLLL